MRIHITALVVIVRSILSTLNREISLGHLAILYLLVVYLLDSHDLGVRCTGSLVRALASTLVTVNRTLNARFVTDVAS